MLTRQVSRVPKEVSFQYSQCIKYIRLYPGEMHISSTFGSMKKHKAEQVSALILKTIAFAKSSESHRAR